VVHVLPYSQGGHAPLAYSAPRWSPDGSWFVFYYADGPEETDGLWLVEGNSEAQHIDTSHLWQDSWTWGHAQPFISPDGNWVVIETGFGNRDKLLLRAGEWEPILWQEPSVMVEGWMALP
jgi:Tol biopolymer transport system component